MTDNFTTRRKIWTNALRSGEYVQSKNGKLQDNKGYCCLGVAGHVAGIDINLETNLFAYDNIKNYYGLEDSLGECTIDINPWGHSCLTDLNDEDIDNGGMTFHQIADLIDTNPEGLFVNETN